MAEDFIKVAQTKEIALNANLGVTVGAWNILICHTKDGFYAVENKCTHQLQALEGGKVKACYIFCPHHGQRYNLKNGQPVGNLVNDPVPTFALTIDGDDIYVSSQPATAAAQD